MKNNLIKPLPVDGVLFDMDGLLLDTEIIYTKVTQQIVARFGKTFDWSIKANMIGRLAEDSSRYLVKALDLPLTSEQYMVEREELLEQLFPDCQPLPEAEKLIRHLYQHNVPIAVATSSSRGQFILKTMHHQPWFKLFNVVITGDDSAVKKGKPAPDIFLAAASKLNIKPHKALVFEDAPSGLQAGLEAGMQVLAIPDPHMDQSRYAGATQILNTLSEFCPEEFGLPPWCHSETVES